MKIQTLLAALMLLPGAAIAGDADDAALSRLADQYFDGWYFPANPTEATRAGVHTYDGQLEDNTRAGIKRRIAALQEYEQRFSAVNPALLSGHWAANRQLLLSSARSRLLDLEEIRPWEKDPDSYPSGLAYGAFVIMARQYAPTNERLQLLVARERLMPAALKAARANLHNPPAIFTTIALEQLPDTIEFFRNDVPAAFADADDKALRADFAASNANVIAALQAYEKWLQTELQPRSHGDFRLGEALFRRKLLIDEMVDTPLPRLLEIGMADLRRNQREFARVARELEPGKSTRQVLAQLGADHPPPAQLLDEFRKTFDGLEAFLAGHAILTVHSDVRPIVEATPAFARATTFASMDTPGPYEQVASEAYFNVTLPDPAWDAATTESFMSRFNYPGISNTAIHEAYPGHYMQFLSLHDNEDRVRRLLGANTNAEGWAHYCEQMMLDEGFGKPGAGASAASLREWRMLRLGQLNAALWRDARFIVAIKLHTGAFSFEQAVDFFVKEGYQSAKVGEMETRRAAGNPMYLYYTLGKLQILKLRADLQRRQGAQFSLRAFHDDFLREGLPPLKIVRRALLHDDSPTL